MISLNRRYLILLLSLIASVVTLAQDFNNEYDAFGNDDTYNTMRPNRSSKDSTKTKKEAPRGMYVWTVDDTFGDIARVDRDTIQHLFMKSIFTTGKYGQYNTTGNLGAPRINRIFADKQDFSTFLFANPFSFFYTPVNELRFTNTLAPITLINFNSCGNKQDGEDHLQAYYAVNAGKRLGAGFKFDYIYGRGLYSNQSTSLFDWTYWTSYIGERYQAHFIFSTNHSKITENGGILNDEYITHPEQYEETFTPNEIPTVLSNNWNRLNSLHFFLTHKYNVGFNRKVPMTEEEIEARRFAIASQKEANERKLKEEAQKKFGKSTGNANATQRFSGRPDNAKIMGDLNVDSIAHAEMEKARLREQALADSLDSLRAAVPVDTTWLKDEYVPVTSFIHTLKFDSYNRTYIAKSNPAGMYLNRYQPLYMEPSDSINDETKHYSLRNTFSIAMLEGFNKWAKSGLKAYIAHDLQHYELPDSNALSSSYNEMSVYIGGQLIKTQGRTLHYNAKAELGVVGKNAGDFRVDAQGDLNIKLMGDTTRLIVNGFIHDVHPDFLYRHYHSNHFWWDDDKDKIFHTHLEGKVKLDRTNTSLRFAYDNITNYTYLAVSNERSSSGMPTAYTVNSRQTSHNISVITAELCQDFRFGIFNWENRVTFQKSTEKVVIPVPSLNIWTNFYLDFKIARVLKCHIGADATYFTEYYAPEYTGQLASYAIQENDAVRTKVGNYPFVNLYANFVLKGCRFFAMMSHVNAGNGKLNYFTTPHHPMNDRIFRIGLSWYFHN